MTRTTSTRIGLAVGLAVLVLAPTGATVAQSTAQQHFRSPDAAFKALLDAARADDQSRLLVIFGPDSEALVSSGDPVADRTAATHFVRAAKEKTKLVKDGDSTVLFHIGKADWPFPIPLVKDGDGWRFDAAAGKEEILNRRIGRNELNTITVCHAYVDAQREYASQDRNGAGVREYAQKFHSEPGKHDGLYWNAAAKEAQSPIGPLVAEATTAGYALEEAHAEPVPFHGYLYKILTAQGAHAPGGERSYIVNGHMTGGFALVAYPAQYGSSGIMTFVVNQLGIVFQKNLGEKTGEIAAAMTQYDPDDSWSPAGE